MKIHTPFYYASMLAHLSQGQDLDSKCAVGPVLYAGGWQEFMLPQMDARCPRVILSFLDDDETHTITIEEGDTICQSYRYFNVSVPTDTPAGLAKLTWLCDSDDKSFCQVASIRPDTRITNVTAPVAEYAMVQNCLAGAIDTAKKFSDGSDRHSTPATAPFPTSPAALTATTPGNPWGTAPTHEAPDSAGTYDTVTLPESITRPSAALSLATQLPTANTDTPSHMDDENHRAFESDGSTGSVGDDMKSATIVTPGESYEGDSRATPTAGTTDGTASGSLEVTKTPGPPSPSNGEQMPSNDRPCTCG